MTRQADENSAPEQRVQPIKAQVRDLLLKLAHDEARGIRRELERCRARWGNVASHLDAACATRKAKAAERALKAAAECVGQVEAQLAARFETRAARCSR